MLCEKTCRTAVCAITILSSFGLLTSCNSSSSSTVALNGAGSTFVYPVMGRWIQNFSESHANVRINYQSIGSGGGIQQVKSGTIDFGASEIAIGEQRQEHVDAALNEVNAGGFRTHWREFS